MLQQDLSSKLYKDLSGEIVLIKPLTILFYDARQGPSVALCFVV